MADMVPEDERILMDKFPLRPQDIVVMPLNHIVEDERPYLGQVLMVYSRNPDPGYTIALSTQEDFDRHVAGPHSSVHLTQEQSMWALIVFMTPAGPVAKIFHTYELLSMIAKNYLTIVDPRDFFSIYSDIMLHSI